MTESSIASMREEIARTYNVIRPYIRRTPVVDINAADFGLDPLPLVLKLAAHRVVQDARRVLQSADAYRAGGGGGGCIGR